MEKSNIAHYLSSNVLGWCFIKIMWDVIEKMFDGYDDWNLTVSVVNNYIQNDMKINEIEKYAVVLAYQAITAATSAKNVICFDSRYWHNKTHICNFGIKIYEELSYYREPLIKHIKC